MQHTKTSLITYLAAFTTQPIEKVSKDLERDLYMTAQEALQYGLIDEIITHHKQPQPPQQSPPASLHIIPPLPIYEEMIKEEKEPVQKEWYSAEAISAAKTELPIIDVEEQTGVKVLDEAIELTKEEEEVVIESPVVTIIEEQQHYVEQEPAGEPQKEIVIVSEEEAQQEVEEKDSAAAIISSIESPAVSEPAIEVVVEELQQPLSETISSPIVVLLSVPQEVQEQEQQVQIEEVKESTPSSPIIDITPTITHTPATKKKPKAKTATITSSASGKTVSTKKIPAKKQEMPPVMAESVATEEDKKQEVVKEVKKKESSKKTPATTGATDDATDVSVSSKKATTAKATTTSTTKKTTTSKKGGAKNQQAAAEQSNVPPSVEVVAEPVAPLQPQVITTPTPSSSSSSMSSISPDIFDSFFSSTSDDQWEVTSETKEVTQPQQAEETDIEDDDDEEEIDVRGVQTSYLQPELALIRKLNMNDEEREAQEEAALTGERITHHHAKRTKSNTSKAKLEKIQQHKSIMTPTKFGSNSELKKAMKQAKKVSTAVPTIADIVEEDFNESFKIITGGVTASSQTVAKKMPTIPTKSKAASKKKSTTK